MKRVLAWQEQATGNSLDIGLTGQAIFRTLFLERSAAQVRYLSDQTFSTLVRRGVGSMALILSGQPLERRPA
jgi:hypothetical protein